MLARVNCEVLIIATGQNIKRAAHLWEPGTEAAPIMRCIDPPNYRGGTGGEALVLEPYSAMVHAGEGGSVTPVQVNAWSSLGSLAGSSGPRGFGDGGGTAVEGPRSLYVRLEGTTGRVAELAVGGSLLILHLGEGHGEGRDDLRGHLERAGVHQGRLPGHEALLDPKARIPPGVTLRAPPRARRRVGPRLLRCCRGAARGARSRRAS
jgi:hypothetical protein